MQRSHSDVVWVIFIQEFIPDASKVETVKTRVVLTQNRNLGYAKVILYRLLLMKQAGESLLMESLCYIRMGCYVLRSVFESQVLKLITWCVLPFYHQ